MTKPIDLSGVDPARWPEIRRRVAALNEFIALSRPARRVRRVFARRVGLSESQFMHLAQIWRISRRASDLPGARSRLAKPKAKRLPARSIGIANETIADLGPSARRKDVIAEVAHRCHLEHAAAPSDSTIANLLAEARAATTDVADAVLEILIDECSALVPVAWGDEVVLPRMLLAVALPQRRILATETTSDPRGLPSLDGLMEKLAPHMRTAGARLPIRAPHRSPMERLSIGAAPLDEGRGLPTLGRVLGRTIGDVRVVYQIGKARSAQALVTSRHSRPIDPADAVMAIASAIESHNERTHAIADLASPAR